MLSSCSDVVGDAGDAELLTGELDGDLLQKGKFADDCRQRTANPGHPTDERRSRAEPPKSFQGGASWRVGS